MTITIFNFLKIPGKIAINFWKFHLTIYYYTQLTTVDKGIFDLHVLNLNT